MTYPIRDIQVPETISEVYSTATVGNRITNLSRLNVFIGPNNCGKSRLLRELFAAKPLIFSLGNDGNEGINRLVGNLLQAIERTDIDPSKREQAQPTLDASFPQLQTESGQKVNVPEQVDISRLEGLHHPNNFFPADSNEGKASLDCARQLFGCLKRERSRKVEQCFFKKLYIPSLRGLRTPESEKNFYLTRTTKDYFEATRQGLEKPKGLDKLEIITGLELYDEVESHQRGNLSQRKMIIDYEQFLGATFFDGNVVSLIPRKGEDVLYVKIGDEMEQPIFNLGDGVQHLIIMTISLFIHRDKNLLLFIEEPELYLHPGFQRLLIESILEEDGSSRQVFVATHSNHFLDITIDQTRCSVYKVTKKFEDSDSSSKERIANFHIQNTTNEDFSLLRELGVRNSSVLLSNCTIWVEGIMDRLYFRAYLKLFQESMKKKFVEDLHYSFVEYGGGNITHWSFLDENEGINAKRVCGNLFLIADRDEDKKKKKLRHKELERTLGDRYYRLNVREVENLLTPQVITSVIQDYEGGDANLNSFSQSNYKLKYLGEFIEDEVFEDISEHNRQTKTGHPYKDTTGTLKDKKGFCKRAINAIRSFDDDLSPEAKNLTKRLHKFILDQQK